MNAKHTPGPWGVNDRRQIVGGGALIAALYGVRGADNGPIIAAAPDLLAVVESVAFDRFSFEDTPEVLINRWRAAARAAIAKATGAA